MDSLPTGIRIGMPVFDNTQAEIGKVDELKFSDENPNTPGAEVVDINPGDRRHDESLIENLAEALDFSDEMPEVLRERLMREGYVRIDSSGLFKADRYVLPGQIASVANDRLTLNVSKKDLIKKD